MFLSRQKVTVPCVGKKEVHTDTFYDVVFGGDLLQSVHGGANKLEALCTYICTLSVCILSLGLTL